MTFARAVLFAALIALPAHAEQAVAPVSSGRFAYAGYLAGLNVFDIQSAVELRQDGYQLGIGFQTMGLAGAFLHGDMLAHSQGVWRPSRVVPQHFHSGGIWLGSPHIMDIEYPDGQPHIVTLIPLADTPREPIPDAAIQGTADALSAIAYLLHTVATTGGCEGQLNTFDGRRVTRIAAHSAGNEILPLESRSSYAGPALRRDMDSLVLAGLPLNAGPDDSSRKTQHSSIWVATLQPGLPPVPVMMSFEVHLLGHMTLYVTKIEQGSEPGRFNPVLPPVAR